MSPHEVRHGAEFIGLLLPFGCEVGYLPLIPVRKAAHKFAPKSRKGVFLGWHMLLGGKWSGDYLVADLADFEAGAFNVRVYQVKELIQPIDITFPLAGIAKHVELIFPGEEFVVGESGRRQRILVLLVGPILAQLDLRT